MKDSERLIQANLLVQGAKNEISRIYPDDFGSSMLQFDPLHQEGILTAHRLRSKFFKPNATNDKQLEKKAFENWLDFDLSLKPENWINCDRSVLLYKARTWLHGILSDFKVDYSKVEITPGETFISARGKVSVYQKLKSRRHWTVTHDAAEDFIRLCYNTLWLKRCAKAHMRKRTKLELRKLYAFALVKGEKHIGYSIFRRLMLNDVLTIVQGSRASSVPKDNEKRRFINVEAFGNVILQRCVALSLRSILAKCGNNLSTGQQDHKDLISNSDIATIDFSNASDSVILSWVRWLFPPKVSKYLVRYRSFITYVGNTAHAPTKLSSMGNGFTFEVMTMMLLSIARVLDRDARVYGDDVIIHNLVARDFVETCAEIGFQTNDKKTFINSPFRESCGAFYHDELGYLTTYEYHWIESMADYVVTANKAYAMAKGSKNPDVKRIFNNLYRALLKLAPTSLIGPDHLDRLSPTAFMVDWDNSMSAWHFWDFTVNERVLLPSLGLDSYIFCRNWRKHHENDDISDLHKILAENWCLTPNDVCVVAVWSFKNDQVTPAFKDVNNVFKAAHYFYSGKRSKDENRNEGKWVKTQYFLTASGARISVRDAGQYYGK